MTESAKKILSSIWVIVSALGVALGILVDLPQAIAKMQWPSWLANPDLLWVAGGVFISAIVLILIWWPDRLTSARRVWSRTPLFFTEYQLYEMMMRAINRVKHGRNPQEMRQIASDLIEQDIPAFLGSLLGKAQKDKYRSAIAVAKEHSTDPIDIFSVTNTYIDGLLLKSMNEKLQKIRESVTVNTPVLRASASGHK